MKLKIPKLVTRAHLPSVINVGTQVMSGTVDVNGAAIDASATDREIPMWAAFRAFKKLRSFTFLCIIINSNLSRKTAA